MSLWYKSGNPEKVIAQLIRKFGVFGVFKVPENWRSPVFL